LSQDILLEEDEENIVSNSESGSPEEAGPSIGLKPLTTPTPPRKRKRLGAAVLDEERVMIRDATTAVIARLREEPAARKNKYAVFGSFVENFLRDLSEEAAKQKMYITNTLLFQNVIGFQDVGLGT
ncbi:hypothetical protein OESDEN_22203, partial [Oesophagostomum dentatum]